jgi:hypothetical protein
MDSASSFSSSRGPNTSAVRRPDIGEADTGETDTARAAPVDPEVGETSQETQPSSRVGAMKARVARLTGGTRTQVAERTAASRAHVAERTAGPRTQVVERVGDTRSKLATLSAERPELVVGAAFAGGIVIATILKRLARKQRTA